MEPTITRLRGDDAPALVWPEETIRPLIIRSLELRVAFMDVPDTSENPRVQGAYDRAKRDAWTTFYVARQACVAEFAKANGMARSKGFNPYRLIGKPNEGCLPAWLSSQVDHADYMVIKTTPHALIGHNYNPLYIDELPESLIVDALPEGSSWYSPQTYGIVVRRGLLTTRQAQARR
jgi:hypothetical protein